MLFRSAEAGTGTGKTFAYLVPALLAGGKVIVSTGTKTLQNQLYDRDLPAMFTDITTLKQYQQKLEHIAHANVRLHFVLRVGDGIAGDVDAGDGETLVELIKKGDIVFDVRKLTKNFAVSDVAALLAFRDKNLGLVGFFCLLQPCLRLFGRGRGCGR